MLLFHKKFFGWLHSFILPQRSLTIKFIKILEGLVFHGQALRFSTNVCNLYQLLVEDLQIYRKM
jgi:hypothetical protein